MNLPQINIWGMLYSIPALLIGLTLHEVAHGFVAWKLGDPTAKNLGRLSLNPLKHLEWLGALFLLVFGFGWAKPVPVNPLYFRGDRKKGMLWVSLAGPATNLVIAILTAIVWKIVTPHNEVMATIIGKVFLINLILAIFNFLPVPPLDGSKILAGVLPSRFLPMILNFERFGFAILILLSLTGILGMFLGPIMRFMVLLITGLFGAESILFYL